MIKLTSATTGGAVYLISGVVTELHESHCMTEDSGETVKCTTVFFETKSNESRWHVKESAAEIAQQLCPDGKVGDHAP